MANKPVAEMTPVEFRETLSEVAARVDAFWNLPEMQAVVRSYVRKERKPSELSRGKRRWHSLRTHRG